MTLQSNMPMMLGALPPRPNDELTSPIIEITPSTPRDRGVLVESSSMHAGRLHSLKGDVSTLGRGIDCTAHFDDVTLSRVHARIKRQGPIYVFEDAGSTNGSFVNGRRVAGVELMDGDRIRLGAAVLLSFQLVSGEEEEELARMFEGAVRDGATGLYNRRHFDERLVGEVSYAVRHSEELSLVLLSVDRFKQISQQHGYRAADQVLRQVVTIVKPHVRAEDLFARLAGEDFAMVLRGIRLAGATRLAERMAALVEEGGEITTEKGTVRPALTFAAASLACCGGLRTPERFLACAADRLKKARNP